MSYLVDTNVLTEMTRKEPNPAVFRWLKAEEQRVFISVITVGEIVRGVQRLPPGVKRERLLEWIERGVKANFARRIIPVDLGVMEKWALLQARMTAGGRSLPILDSLIAATAAVHQLTVVSRNVADFSEADVPLLNPWDWRGD